MAEAHRNAIFDLERASSNEDKRFLSNSIRVIDAIVTRLKRVNDYSVQDALRALAEPVRLHPAEVPQAPKIRGYGKCCPRSRSESSAIRTQVSRAPFKPPVNSSRLNRHCLPTRKAGISERSAHKQTVRGDTFRTNAISTVVNSGQFFRLFIDHP